MTGQPDLFALGGDPTLDRKKQEAEQEARRQARLLARRQLLDSIARRLADAGLWGYPNSIKNPAAPWDQWRGAGGSPDLHRLCWPGSYQLLPREREPDGEPSLLVTVQAGQRENPALVAALPLLREVVARIDFADQGEAWATPTEWW